MSKNVLVIGNGYDLAHDLKTAYNHFIDYIRESRHQSDNMLTVDERKELAAIISCNGFVKYFMELDKELPGWIDFEREIRKLTQEMGEFFYGYKNIMLGNNRVSAKAAGKLLTKILLCFEIAASTDMGNVIEPRFYSPTYGLQTIVILKELKVHLDQLVRALELYLLRCQREFKNSNTANNCINKQIAEIDPSYVISFNYTDTYKVYGINNKDVWHVHGCLEQKNMVLGFNDDDPENLDFVYFKKYFQRIQKLTGYIDGTRLNTYDKNGFPDYPFIHFYGHSLDKTDGDIIQMLKGMSKGFIVYQYNQEDYEQKVINLIDIFGKDEATDMIQKGFVKFVQCE